MSLESDKKGASVRFPPPLLVLAVILLAWIFDYFFPTGFGAFHLQWFVGVVIIAVSVLIIIISGLSFKQAKTTIEPWKPTSSIISTGVFRYSRNPIYLAFCVFQFGTAFLLDNLWVLTGLPLSMLLLFLVAIRKEENYLETKFGKDYLDYQSRVRRWL